MSGQKSNVFLLIKISNPDISVTESLPQTLTFNLFNLMAKPIDISSLGYMIKPNSLFEISRVGDIWQ